MLDNIYLATSVEENVWSVDVVKRLDGVHSLNALCVTSKGIDRFARSSCCKAEPRCGNGCHANPNVIDDVVLLNVVHRDLVNVIPRLAQLVRRGGVVCARLPSNHVQLVSERCYPTIASRHLHICERCPHAGQGVEFFGGGGRGKSWPVIDPPPKDIDVGTYSNGDGVTTPGRKIGRSAGPGVGGNVVDFNNRVGGRICVTVTAEGIELPF